MTPVAETEAGKEADAATEVSGTPRGVVRPDRPSMDKSWYEVSDMPECADRISSAQPAGLSAFQLPTCHKDGCQQGVMNTDPPT